MNRVDPSAYSRSLEEELLRALARQTRRVPVPIFLLALMIAGLALDRVPISILVAWLALVVAVLALRWAVLGRLPGLTQVPERKRVRIAIVLSLINGITHALSLGFFPFLPEFERAIQSMLFVALCAGSVATTAGYMPVFLAYILPMVIPLSTLWALSPGIAEVGWIERSTALLSAMLGVLLFALARDAFRLFRESFEMRLQQAELNRQLQVALEQAEVANRAKTRFLASASHDLRQPLQTLEWSSERLTERPLDEVSRKIAERMNTAIEVLSSQFDGLLDISRLDAGVIRANPIVVNLRGPLERICNELSPAVGARGLKIVLECPQTCLIEIDQFVFERVVRNLLDNAIKYTDAGLISLQVTREERDIVLTIADTGRGIPEEEHVRVFEEFYQLENPERDRTRGLGLGLAIVRRLVDLLRIRMKMTSSPGKGTSFHLTMPSAEHAQSAPTDPRDSHPTPVALHVLLVDDEAEVRDTLRSLLVDKGHRATLADSTQMAIRATQAEKPDIVVSDLRLRGDESGIKAVHAIRQLYPGMPAILLTGETAPERLREAEHAGIRFLHKPVQWKVLLQAITEELHLQEKRHE